MANRHNHITTRDAVALGKDLMLAPMVMALRLPLMAMEARDKNVLGVETARAVSEKTTALVEGMVAAQLSLMRSAAGFWFDIAAGRTPDLLSGVAAERSMREAIRPARRRVRANYRRLSKSS